MKKVIGGIIVALLLGALGWTNRDQIEVRFNCAGKITQQFSTQQVVPGAWNCIEPYTQQTLDLYYGIKNEKDFAKFIGTSTVSVHYLGKTNDGGYTFRMDQAQTAHNSFITLWNAIKDPAFWKFAKNHPGDTISAVGDEMNGYSQGWVSLIQTIYLYPPNTYEMVGTTSIDISGRMAAIK